MKRRKTQKDLNEACQTLVAYQSVKPNGCPFIMVCEECFIFNNGGNDESCLEIAKKFITRKKFELL